MTKHFLLSVISLFIFSGSVHAAKIIKVKNKKAVVLFESEKVSENDSMEAYDSFGNLTAVLKVYKVKKGKAYSNIIRGTAKSGFLVKLVEKKKKKKKLTQKKIERKTKDTIESKNTSKNTTKNSDFESGIRLGAGAVSDDFFTKSPVMFAGDYYVPYKNRYIVHYGASYWMGTSKDNEVSVLSLELSAGLYHLFNEKHRIEYGSFFSASYFDSKYVLNNQVVNDTESKGNVSPYISYSYHINKSVAIGFDFRASTLISAHESSSSNLQYLIYLNLL